MPLCKECLALPRIRVKESALRIQRGVCRNAHNSSQPCANMAGGYKGVHPGQTSSPQLIYCSQCSETYHLCQRCGRPTIT